MRNNNTQIKSILNEHSGLTYEEKTRVLSGYITVDQDDEYQIAIAINPFPDRFPEVRETGERIARTIDNHIYSDGQCCFTTAAKEQLLIRKGIIRTLPQFINKIVVPFFQNNSYREINDSYHNGEYSHGAPGILEAYSDILDVSDKWKTISTLVYFLNYPPLCNHNLCYCGSGNTLKECHLDNYRDLSYISRKLIRNDLKMLPRIIS